MRQTNIDDDDDDDFPGGICRDGGSVRVATTFMDSRRRFAQLTDEQTRRFQPGFRACADADPNAKANAGARETYLRELQTAWKGQPSWTAPPSDIELAEKVAAILRMAPPRATRSSAPLPGWTRGSDARDARDARLEMIKRASEAWRTPAAHDAAQPDLGSRLEELRRHQEQPAKADPKAALARAQELENWRGRDLSELAIAVETRRRAIHAEYSRNLENAWRGGK
jgi:hypothetical protein